MQKTTMQKTMQEFLADDAGAGTIMSIFWFLVFVAFAGLAVDVTDGLRNRTMLQATADSAALAAAIDLPDAGTAVTTARQYAAANMDPSVHGWVLDDADVVVGRWGPATNTVDTADPTPDAVWVTTWRGAANVNPLPVSFLRVLGLDAWNVRAQAVAQRYIPDCTRNGLIAGLQVNIESDNDFYNNICVHGQTGVNLQNHNDFETGTNVTMPEMGLLETPSDECEGSNTGLCEALREANRYPRLVKKVEEIMASLLADTTDSPWAPSYITDSQLKKWTTQNFDAANLTPGTINFVRCPNDNNLINIPAIEDGVHGVVIIAECRIQIAANALVYDVVIASRSNQDLRGKPNSDDLRELADITTAAGTQIGLPDDCKDGGEAILLSNGSVHFPAQLKFDGAQLVARNNIDFGANGNYFYGITAQAGRNIALDSLNDVGLCPNSLQDIYTVWYYRLVM